MSKKKIVTKFGNAKIGKGGYYIITSKKEGNNNKKLHRLIFEDFYKVTLLSFVDIHHKDGDKLNNNISNLKAVYHWEHQRQHKQGEGNPNYKKQFSLETMAKMSKSQNKSGYFRVYKKKDKKAKQGFNWCYSYRENNKTKCIMSTDIEKLKKKVIKKGFEWIEF